jgi:hypothetical protein
VPVAANKINPDFQFFLVSDMGVDAGRLAVGKGCPVFQW